MLSSKIWFKNTQISILKFLKNNGITILKPPDEDMIAEEYKQLECFMLSNCNYAIRNISNEEVLEWYDNYKENLFLQGETAIDINLVGPPLDDVAVLLNKYAMVLQEDPETIDYLFPFYEIASKLIERNNQNDW